MVNANRIVFASMLEGRSEVLQKMVSASEEKICRIMTQLHVILASLSESFVSRSLAQYTQQRLEVPST